MPWSQATSRRILGALVLGLVAVGAWHLAPAQVGGRATYVTTFGDSMLPGMRPGAVSVLKERKEYDVGDIVAYTNPDINAIILHRVVAVEDGRYTLRGDNRDEDDRYRPSEADIVGERWIHVPGAGNILLSLREPPVAGAVLGLAAFAAMRPMARRHRRRLRHRRV